MSYIHIIVYMYICICIYVRIHVYIYIYTYICVYTYMHIYTHMCICRVDGWIDGCMDGSMDGLMDVAVDRSRGHQQFRLRVFCSYRHNSHQRPPLAFVRFRVEGLSFRCCFVPSIGPCTSDVGAGLLSIHGSDLAYLCYCTMFEVQVALGN